jgi:hypothetical protein
MASSVGFHESLTFRALSPEAAVPLVYGEAKGKKR